MMACGEECALINGGKQMQLWCAGSWDTQAQVKGIGHTYIQYADRIIMIISRSGSNNWY